MIYFIIGIVSVVVLTPVIEWAIDNNESIDQEKERELTNYYMEK